MPSQAVWSDAAEFPAYPPLATDQRTDVVVIGGGITGATAAYLLTKAGRSVVLLERNRCGGGDTGHTTAHLTHVTDLRFAKLAGRFGKDHARAVVDAGQAAMNFIHETIHAENLACDFAWLPGYLHAAPGPDSDREAESLRAEARLAVELGFEAKFLDAVPVTGLPGVRFPRQARFHPLKYIRGLLAAAAAGGAQIFENSEVASTEKAPLTLMANGRKIICQHLVVATHVPLTGIAGLIGAALFQSKLAPHTSYAVGAAAAPEALPEGLWWDTADPYSYLRIDRRENGTTLILGGRDHKTGQQADAEARYCDLEAKLREYAPQATLTHRWSGQVIETADGLPYLGEVTDQQFIATGFSGNGMTFGTLGAMLASDAITRQSNPWSDLFRPSRLSLGGTWDYLMENLDYPYYMARDRIAASEGTSLDQLQPNEGKILRLDGERVAAYRDAAGRVTKLSPTCTHLGCLVRWNPAETSWDCPCHGSRFQPTGEVLAGPAETPLAVASANE